MNTTLRAAGGFRLMQCHRCQGTMNADYFVDLATSGEIWMAGWRCLMCGEIVDPLIEHHRQLQREHRKDIGASAGSAIRRRSPISVKPRKITRDPL